MARSPSADAKTTSRWGRRMRRLAVVGTVVGVLAAVRERVLRRDQRRFDAQYGARS